ncbi:MAG: phospho-N-acetylmuramoyl-pentapeptide-transferase [Clostridiaceae bacterium]|nr:phospho-N-acetylmuramoyl-pentapeptide-transferase [Clostridiaceae bacterium]
MSLFLHSLASFMVSALLGPILIPVLKKLKFGQSILMDGPSWHASKAGTPTMGGILFITSSILLSLSLFFDPKCASIVIVGFFYGLIGFVDDFMKIKHKQNKGLTARQKFLAQCAVTIVFLIVIRYLNIIDTTILLPFTKIKWDLGILFIPFAAIFMLGTVNSVNLTDGLDGLAASISCVVALFFLFVANMQDLQISKVMAALLGGVLGFLIYNFYPAKIFMGDTGSLYLGGILAATAVLMDLEVIFILCGIVFFIEALSVILQVISYKTTKKRIFKMAPIHHHFEKSGWHETKVVFVFTFVSVIFCIIALLSII